MWAKKRFSAFSSMSSTFEFTIRVNS
jgi:hypothetical protein